MSKPYSAEELKWFEDNNYSITTRSKEDKSKVVSILEMISRFLATIAQRDKEIESIAENLDSALTDYNNSQSRIAELEKMMNQYEKPQMLETSENIKDMAYSNGRYALAQEVLYVIEECKERLHHTFTGGVGVECNKPYSGVCSCGIDELLTAIAKLKEEK